MKLYEEIFDAVNGISTMLIDALNKKWESITNFNSIIVNLQEVGYDDMIGVINSILEDEHKNVGQLQQLIELLNPIATEIESGKEETIDILDNRPELPENTLTDFDPDKIFIIESLSDTKNIERNRKLLRCETVESLQEDVDENAHTFYVSYYEEAPAYHPEEGGYFVATRELIFSEEFDNLEDAKARIAELAEEDVGFKQITDEYYLNRSRYIGQDRMYIIETEKGSEEKGDEIYQ